MNVSMPFILRPVATILLSIGILLTGIIAYRFLPVSALPSVDLPAIVVFVNQPGADPETMASSIAAPLERRLGEISGVMELISTNSVGASNIVVIFDLDRSVDSAAQDVQAAINAARADLPSDLPVSPFIRKFNPAEAPVMMIALTSDSHTIRELYDLADSMLGQRLAQVNGVSQVQINGAEKPAVRISTDPMRLAAASLSGQDLYNVVRNTNVTQPTGVIENGDVRRAILINGQIDDAESYRKVVLKASNGGFLRLGDITDIVDGVANTRLSATSNGKPAILLQISKQSGANVIETVDGIKKILPQLRSWLPGDINMAIVVDRTGTIRASVDDVQFTLLVSIALVLMVVFVFMRRLMPTIAAAVTVPLSISGTLGAMWLLGYSLDNFSLMAITIGVGFVVDDAIVMIENIVRHMEMGKSRLRAAIDGASQIGFTVISITLSLLAVFIPIIFMPGIQGRLFHEFVMTLSVSIVISAVVSLTLTPMLMGVFGRQVHALDNPLLRRWDERVEHLLNGIERFYLRTLGWALKHSALMLLSMVLTIAVTVTLYRAIPKSFLPIQDTGLLQGSTIARPDISYAAMRDLQHRAEAIIRADPAVLNVDGRVGVSNGFNALNRGMMYIQLKPLEKRHVSSEQVIARLRPKLGTILGLETFLHSAQDLRMGGREDSGQFEYVLQADDIRELRSWAQRLQKRLQSVPEIADVSSDQDHAGPEIDIMIDRDTASRLGTTVSGIDSALNNAFSQRQISRIYTDRNQYQVVLQALPSLQSSPAGLNTLYVPATNVNGTAAPATASRATLQNATGQVTLGSAVGGTQIGGNQVPLMALAHTQYTTAPLSIDHEAGFPSASLSFNIKPGIPVSTAQDAVLEAVRSLGMPASIRGEFGGNLALFKKAGQAMPFLLIGALAAIYVVLGVLYESLIQPLTILSTLPSAGLGALIALLLAGVDLSLISIIGIVLLMGIVKKNGIMLVDFALEQQRDAGLDAASAIREACAERFRPILMTTLAALLGAVPLAFSFGTGAELRQPLGISIIGGLIASQILTLYTTPIIYLALEKLARRGKARPAINPS
ncbi:efflux RND transporter permease subunit [Granulibacter bethesdensis]|uniref:efflux RND transporter permease subunit n=1 Tax=Granulibacter bethesdensis TaxID=364410 RepID=UPI000909A845|nr:efflux RND transporter permease subunit [Granulibacter bethesdensis]APH52040.1 Acriflavin resistance plasma membrane protein [Granulibacter bethesdensis]